MKARTRLALVVAILLAAAVVRSYRLAEVPPGIEHDEVAEWQIARGILAGHHAIFFREAYGQEPVYLYLQAASITLLGDSVFALRFTSFVVAMLTMAACYRLIRRWFGPVAALVSLALIAVTLWPLFFARVAIRGMTLPLVMCLGADALFSILNCQSSIDKSAANRQWCIAGLWFGLTAYTYLAARAIPILLLAFVAHLALFAREQMRGKWHGLVAMLAVAVLVAAPLTAYLLSNPNVQFRVDEVSGPLKQLQQGDPSGVLAGVRDTALMFSVRGDQTVRDNWPYRPVFAEPLSAALFYIGLGVALWHWRKPAYAFMLLWLIALLLPTMVTAAPPNFVRTLGALPAIFGFPGVGAAVLVNGARALSHRLYSLVALRSSLFVLRLSSFVILIGLNLFLTTRDYFVHWPAHPETQFVWQTDLASIANYLDSARDTPGDIAIAGLSNEAMDDDSLHLLMKRRDLAVRWFDSRTTLIIPTGGGRLFIPDIVPLDPYLRARLVRWGMQEHTASSSRFAWFDSPAIRVSDLQAVTFTPEGTLLTLPSSLDNGIVLLGYEGVSPQAKPGGEVIALSYWQAEALPPSPLKAFGHLIDVGGKLIAQSDGLNAPPQFWHSGDVIVQLHRFQVSPDTKPGTYHPELGLYNVQTNVRAQFLDAARRPVADHLVLPDVEVKP